MEETTVKLDGDLEASVYVFAEGEDRVLFAIDEDPVFDQMTVTLLRALKEPDLQQALRETIDQLFHEFNPIRNQDLTS